MIKVCPCGQEFKTKPSSIAKGQGKYCSKACYLKYRVIRIGEHNHRWHGGKPEKRCIICGKSFFSYDCESYGKKKFCSIACRLKGAAASMRGIKNPAWDGGGEAMKCEICGTGFRVSKSAKKRGKGRFCSLNCYYTWRTTLTGTRSYRWVGKVDATCMTCGDKFKVYQKRIDAGEGKFCGRVCQCLYIRSHQGKKPTSIERILAAELTNRGIEFTPQFSVRAARTVVDFFIKPNILLYADGDYWHSRPGAAIKDKRQTATLRRIGFRVYRFLGTTIETDAGGCVDSIKELVCPK